MTTGILMHLLLKYLPASAAAILLLLSEASATTYYASPSPHGSRCSAESRCSLPAALAKMAGGDTLILGDGAYHNQISRVPSGTRGAYTTIKAEHDGEAIISYSADFPLRLASDYVRIEGLKFMNDAVDATADVAFIPGAYNKLFRCAFVSNPTSTNVNKVAVSVTGKYNLLEDCWAWGGGRYKFLAGGQLSENTGHHNIFRRCVARHDREYSDYNPQAAFVNYAGSNNIFQNCIAIDSDQTPYYKGLYRGAWFFEKGSAGKRTDLQGCIVLNVASGLYDSASYDHGGADYLHGDIHLSNLIVWDAGEGFQTWYNYPGRVMALDHSTLGAPNSTGGNDYPGWAFHPGEKPSDGASATNNIFYNWNKSITRSSHAGAVASSGGSNRHNAFYGNSADYHNSVAGRNDITHVNPLTAALKYLPRVESGTALKGAGSNGSDIGATVLNRIGVSGTLHGEAGYDTVTAEPLWPWPNEARIKRDMSSYPPNWPSDRQPNPIRGFTAGTSKDGSSQTLTKYIWEYLGNRIPKAVYASVSGATVARTGTPVTVAGGTTGTAVAMIGTRNAMIGTILAKADTAVAITDAMTDATTDATTDAKADSKADSKAKADATAATAAGAGSAADVGAPAITSFSMPRNSTSLTVPITLFVATDDVAVTGYCVTTTESSAGCSWSATPPSSVTFSRGGVQSVYAWARDAGGKVSAPFLHLLTIAVPTETAPPTGKVYYVRPDGHDDASGLANSRDRSAGAWRTLQHAAEMVFAGDTVNVADGDYKGFMIDRSGTATEPITFHALGKGANITTPNGRTRDGINIESYSATPDYIVIDGFTVRDQPRMGIRAIGGKGIVIKNNTVHDCGDCGIFSGNTPSMQVLNNTTYKNGRNGYQHNIYISNARSDDCIIRGNTVFGANGGNGIQLNGDWQEGGDGYISNALVENNIVYNNHHKGLSLISVKNGTFRNNIIYNNGLGGAAGGIHLVDQLGHNFSTDNVVVNNTIDEGKIACVRINAGSTNNVVFNNICIGSSGIVFEGSGNQQSNNYSSTSGAGIFADYGGHDYRLAAGSPAIGYGAATYQSAGAPAVDCTGTPRRSFDAGAYRFTAPSTSSDPVSGTTETDPILPGAGLSRSGPL